MSKATRAEPSYPGDEAWGQFVAAAPGGFEEFRGAEALVTSLSGNKEIAAIVYAIIGGGAIKWVQLPQERLDGLAPVECVFDARLMRRLRAMLMQMPV